MTDPNCPTGGTICSGSNGNSAENYKRITVVVTMNGVAHPAKPMLVSAIVADPNALPSGAPSNATQNPLQSVNTQCGGGSCTQALTGTAVDYYLTDSPSGGSYQPPTASNPLHQTLTSFACTLGGLPSTCPPKPDQLITTPPSTGGELPPCAATNLGCVTSTPIPAATAGGPGPNPCNGGIAPTDANGNCSTGLRLPHPSADSSSCPSPPVDNTRSHSWVSSAIPTGTTVNLAGTGGMTMFMQSAGSTAVNVTLCAGVYIQPGGLPGTVTTLLPPAVTQIGATVSVSAQATAGAPTPVSFGFNLGPGCDVDQHAGEPGADRARGVAGGVGRIRCGPGLRPPLHVLADDPDRALSRAHRTLHQLREESGIAVPIVLAVMMVVLALSAAAVLAATANNDLAGRDANQKAALEAADAGLRAATYRLNMLLPQQGYCPTNPATQVGGSGLCAQDGPENLGNGDTFSYWVSDVLGPGAQCAGLPVTAASGLNPQTVGQRCITANTGAPNAVSAHVQIRVASYTAQAVFSVPGLIGLNEVTIRRQCPRERLGRHQQGRLYR